MALDKKYTPLELEKKWLDSWQQDSVYAWDENSSKPKFIVDTPPPTVSGSLHIGHVFSYTQTDIVTRYQRMLGKNVFYPMGWDDNGLPTERRVQNYFGIKCNPNIAEDPSWEPNFDYNPKKDKILEVSRNDFIRACKILTEIDEKAYEEMFMRLGLSVDWTQTYETINEHSRKISQNSFLDLFKKDLVYNSFAPTMWDTGFQSAIAQAELEDRERPGAYHKLKFVVETSDEDFVIATTRPEMLPACIAIVAHPEDARYQHLFGKRAVTPLFSSPVPIMSSEHAEIDKGTGIMMICTFGDVADVDWWKQSDLPAKQIMSLTGQIIDHSFSADENDLFYSLNPDKANKNYKEIANLYMNQARKRIVELLRELTSVHGRDEVALTEEPESITHPVKFYEKGDRPLEFIQTRQWFIKTLAEKENLLAQGKKINWTPAHMRTRYENWVEGLNQDWCISRQRYFGVPFPVWYEVRANGEADYSKPIIPETNELPVDPLSDAPKGYTENQRNQPNGFSGDPDVMDTWATSSMTPQLSSHWSVDDARHKKLFPADIRPQAHEIIRTWAFYTIVKSWLHEKEIPWKNALISGWVLDPERKKMSKSKGNVVTPGALFDEYSADAIRYWSGRAKLGTDTAVDPAIFKTGHKLINKLFNASKFVIMQFERIDKDICECDYSKITHQLDLALVAKVKSSVDAATNHFEKFDYSSALKVSEDLFWDFCDNYLELVKVRSYSDDDTPERESALAALSLSLKTILRLFAPFAPFITEEIWQSSFADEAKSVHISSWPSADEYTQVEKPEYDSAYDTAVELIGKIRGCKTAAQKSLKWEVSELTLKCSDDDSNALKSVLDDLLKAGNVDANGVSFVSGEVSDGKVEIDLKFNENWSA